MNRGGLQRVCRVALGRVPLRSGLPSTPRGPGPPGRAPGPDAQHEGAAVGGCGSGPSSQPSLLTYPQPSLSLRPSVAPYEGLGSWRWEARRVTDRGEAGQKPGPEEEWAFPGRPYCGLPCTPPRGTPGTVGAAEAPGGLGPGRPSRQNDLHVTYEGLRWQPSAPGPSTAESLCFSLGTAGWGHLLWGAGHPRWGDPGLGPLQLRSTVQRAGWGGPRESDRTPAAHPRPTPLGVSGHRRPPAV